MPTTESAGGVGWGGKLGRESSTLVVFSFLQQDKEVQLQASEGAAGTLSLAQSLHGTVISSHLIAEGCQIGGGLLTDGSYLCGWHQCKNILHCGGGVCPELVPECIVCGFHWLWRGGEEREATCTWLSKGRVSILTTEAPPTEPTD